MTDEQTNERTKVADLSRLTWHVPPRNQGQAVEVSYAADEGYVYRRTHDRSTGDVSYERRDCEDLIGDFDPWNGRPRFRDCGPDPWTPVLPEGTWVVGGEGEDADFGRVYMGSCGPMVQWEAAWQVAPLFAGLTICRNEDEARERYEVARGEDWSR